MGNKDDESASPSSPGTSVLSQHRPIVMPEAFVALYSEEWDSWISHFEDCAKLNEWNDARGAQFLAVRMCGAALLQLQSLSPGVRGKYTDLKQALPETFVPAERVKLHKAEFRARHRERDKKLLDLASSLRRLVGKAYPEAVAELQDNLAKDQFIDALEDWEIRLKLQEAGPKTLDDAVNHALQIEAMYEAESHCSKGWSVRVIQEPPQWEKNELMDLLKQNTAAVNQMVQFVQKQHQPPKDREQNQNSRGLGPNVGRAWDLRLRLLAASPAAFMPHKKGHFMADCKQLPAGSGSGNKS